MKISLRPHHLLCLQGYKGFNYSKSQVSSWSNLLKHLTPNTDILIITRNDELCEKCPAILNKEKFSCIEKSVNKLDENVALILDIVNGNIYKYSELLTKIRQKLTPQNHEKLCSNCAWWKKGLCKDSFKK